MYDPIHEVTVEKSGYQHTIELYYDDFSEDPREWDNLCTFALNMRRYALANEFSWLNFDHYNSFDEVLNEVLQREKIIAYKWVRGYSHGGLSLSLSTRGQYSDPWDSGWVGFIFVTEETMQREFPSLSRDEWEAKANEWIEAEFETYNAYVKGEVFAYRVYGDLLEDSCCGFYSDDDAISYAEDEINACVDRRLKAPDTGALIFEMLNS